MIYRADVIAYGKEKKLKNFELHSFRKYKSSTLYNISWLNEDNELLEFTTTTLKDALTILRLIYK